MFFSTYAFASSELYQVDVKSNFAGSKFSRAKFILKEGFSVTYVDSQQSTIEVVATGHAIGDGENIQLDFTISRENKDGESVVVSETKIVTSQKKRSEIEITTTEGSKISLKVVAKKL